MPHRASAPGILLVATALAACGGGVSGRPLDHASPLVRTRFEPPFSEASRPAAPEKRDDTDEEGAGAPADLRARIVAAAEALLEEAPARPGDYGVADLEAILRATLPDLGWRASEGLPALARRAERAGALATDGRPEPGDVVLFHNQRDANGNGVVDDWYTGCGVVVSRDGDRFAAVARTGHAPRRVVAWPDGPARRVVDGDPANSFLRVPHRFDPADTPYLAGRLYAGHVDVERLAAAN